MTQSLTGALAQAGRFSRTGARPLDEKTLRMLRILNRMVIQDALKTELWNNSSARPGPALLEHLQVWLDYREQTVPLLRAAGLRNWYKSTGCCSFTGYGSSGGRGDAPVRRAAKRRQSSGVLPRRLQGGQVAGVEDVLSGGEEFAVA